MLDDATQFTVLMMCLLTKVKNNGSLTCADDELVYSRSEYTPTTRAASQHQPPTIYLKALVYTKTNSDIPPKLFILYPKTAHYMS